MGKKAKQKKPATPPRFAAGDQVRVKQGVKDYDFPDIPIGGWSGTIEELSKKSPPNYLVSWSEHTLKRIPQIFKKRCERDGLELERMWLGEDDLEPDQGGPVEIEQPTNIVTKPLDPKDEDDRIRAVFGLTSDDPLPEVDFDTLKVYRDYLAEQLAIPFSAVWESEVGPFSTRQRQVMVLGLGDPDEDFRIDDMYGLICEVKIDKQRGDAPWPNWRAKKRIATGNWWKITALGFGTIGENSWAIGNPNPQSPENGESFP